MTVEQRLDQLEKLKRRLGLANLAYANLKGATLTGAINVPELSAKQEEDACWSDCD